MKPPEHIPNKGVILTVKQALNRIDILKEEVANTAKINQDIMKTKENALIMAEDDLEEAVRNEKI